MDSSQNWLAFTLSNSNPQHHHQNQDPSLSLLDSYNTSTHHQPQDVSGGGTTSGLDLSMFSSVGPKLENFLGCGSMSVGQFSDTTTTQQSDVVVNGMYGSAMGGGESELKSIAASFLHGYSSLNDHITTTAKAESMAVVPVVTQVDSPSAKKAVETFGQRTSIYRGVTRHRWTGRYEAHLWDNSCRREGQSRKGRQVYLGGYDKEDKAARAYDLAALKYWGPTTTTNFPVLTYEKELEEMKNMSRQEFVASLRRKSSGFSRGASIYRGVTRHHQHGRWQARIGRVAGNKDLYLGTFSTQEEAAEAYDIAAIKFRGLNAVTNFDMSRYDVKSIANNNLPIGGIAGKPKQIASSDSHSDNNSNSECSRSDLSSVTSVSFTSQPSSSSTTLNFAMPIKQDPSLDQYWSLHGFQSNDTNNNNNFSMYQTVGTNGFPFHGLTNLNMEFSGSNNGAYMQQHQQSGLIPFGTPMSLSSNSYDQSNSSPSYGNWVAQSGHGFQSAKPNISVFQTPIYNME